MELDEEKKPLPIPENNPPLKYPVFNGFTSEDLKTLVIIMVIAISIAVVVFLQNNNIFVLLAILSFSLSASVLLLGRDAYAENFLDKIRIYIEFKKSIKKYAYEYVNIYEVIKEQKNEKRSK